ncbi:MAG: Uma2 family endonuclease [Bacteroidetes bacterium]|nr:Uma2 family endonuclease [Fibrella sp.]
MEAIATVAKEIDLAEDRLPTTKAEFLDWSPNDDALYEWHDGTLVQQSGMKKEERPIIRVITRAFAKTTAYQQRAELLAETNCWLTDEQMRIPDLAFFTDEQIKASATDDTEPIPAFVVELISPGDKASHIEKKVLEYFSAGVTVVWHIYPDLTMVRVFTSPKLSTTSFADDTISAGPAIPDLQLTIGELFAL